MQLCRARSSPEEFFAAPKVVVIENWQRQQERRAATTNSWTLGDRALWRSARGIQRHLSVGVVDNMQQGCFVVLCSAIVIGWLLLDGKFGVLSKTLNWLTLFYYHDASILYHYWRLLKGRLFAVHAFRMLVEHAVLVGICGVAAYATSSTIAWLVFGVMAFTSVMLLAGLASGALNERNLRKMRTRQDQSWQRLPMNSAPRE